MRVLLLTVLMMPAAAFLLRTADADEVNPVSKIVKLLKDMQTRLTEEAVTDEKIYEKNFSSYSISTSASPYSSHQHRWHR